MSGQLIGQRYRILRKIGEGGMALVYLAVDEKLGRDIAIKILRERYENHDEIRTRFQHEARAISAFDHPNILKIYDFSGEESKQLWIVTELIHGRNLAQILETTPNGWLHPIIAASIIREICRSLYTAHEHGIVHRDVKPENVMITHQGIVKLMDFGIAKIQRITSMTQTGMFMGSPSYMSPEQVRGRDVDERSDIYSMGVLFYELITGKLPYTGSSTADIAIKILAGEFIHPQYIMAGVPDQLCQIIVQCMEVNPDQRPSTIESIGVKIDRVLESLGLDSSTQELEKCFKDPKSYGERLAKILKITDARSSKNTVHVSPLAQWNNEAIKSPIPRPDISGEKLPIGSQRRDHLLPPKSIPHVSKKTPSAEAIAANLPERRLQPREERKVINFEPTKLDPKRIIQPTAVAHQENSSAEEIKKVSQEFHNYRPREVRKFSRIVPIVPKMPQQRRPIHKVRYIVHEAPQQNSLGFFTKAFVITMIAAALAIVWAGITKNNSQRIRNQVSQQQKIKKQNSYSKITTPNARQANQTDTKVIAIDLKQNPDTKAEEKSTVVAPVKNTASINTTSDSYKSSDAPKSNQPKNKTNIIGSNKTSVNNTVTKDKSNKEQTTISSNFKNATETSLDDASKANNSVSIPTEVLNSKESNTNKNASTSNNSKKTISKGQVSIASNPAAEIYIDGKKSGTTNDLGSTSDWIELSTGTHKLELKRNGFATRVENITVNAEGKDRFGPYTLSREIQDISKSTIYRLTITSNLPPVEISIINIESNVSQTITLNQTSQVISLSKGIYEITMTRKGETKKRRVDLTGTGSASQLTLNADFKESQNKEP